MKNLTCLFVIFLFACNNLTVKPAVIENKESVIKTVILKEINYDGCKQQIALLKQQYKSNWKNISLAEKQEIFTKAVTETIMPAWMGTKWDFNGITQTPRKGAIACGYFVTTVLRDAGIKLARAKLAQQPSGLIIKALVKQPLIKHLCGIDIKTFVNDIKDRGYGLYIVGLDCHVGFLYNDGKQVYFIHSSWIGTKDVQREIAENSIILSRSAYKVIGKISADEKMLDNWIN
jgi:hypothetical protein